MFADSVVTFPFTYCADKRAGTINDPTVVVVRRL